MHILINQAMYNKKSIFPIVKQKKKRKKEEEKVVCFLKRTKKKSAKLKKIFFGNWKFHLKWPQSQIS